MTKIKYPEDLILTKEDFEKSDYLSVLKGVADKGYFAMYEALSIATRKAMGDND